MLILSQQTGYTAKRYITDIYHDRYISRGLISDLLDVTGKFKTKGYLVTIDIKEPFESLDHNVLLTTLEKFDCGIKGTSTDILKKVSRKVLLKW